MDQFLFVSELSLYVIFISSLFFFKLVDRLFKKKTYYNTRSFSFDDIGAVSEEIYMMNGREN
jgi:hypothetical protein